MGDLVPSIINNSQFYETEAIMEDACFDELAEALLGVDFPNNIPSNTLDPEWDFDYDIVDQFITMPSYYNNSASSSDDHNNNSTSNNNQSVKSLEGSGVVIVQEQPRRSKKRKGEETEKEQLTPVNGGGGGKTRKKRHPSQVQDHILAERKRREVLSHMFISISSLIPGLKKMDKTTILGDAIKHMKQLKERVKELEEAAAQHNNTTKKPMVVFKKYQLPIMDDNDDGGGGDDDDENSGTSLVIVDDISGTGASGGNNNNNGVDNNKKKKNKSSSRAEIIEVKISDNTLLLKINCEKHKGVVPQLFAAVDRHDLSITSSVVLPFDNLTLDITILTQMEEGFNNNVKGLVRTLRSILQSTSP